MYNLFRFIGFRHLSLKPLRTILTILGIAFGIALFIAIRIINHSTLLSFEESMEAMAGKASLVITLGGGQGSSGFPEEKLSELKSFKEIKNAVPMVQSAGYFTGDSHVNESLMVTGVDLLKESSVRTYKTTDSEIMDDPFIFLNQPDSVILTKEFAERNHLAIDSKIELATSIGKKTLTVRGLLVPEGAAKAYGGTLAIMDIDGAQVTFGKGGKLDRIDLVTREGVDLDSLSKRIVEKLGAAYQVERPQENSKSMERLVKSYQVLLSFFSTLALLVGVFLVANTVGISVVERRKEIGILRALGAMKVSIATLFVTEAFFMGIIGGGMGVFMGWALAGKLIGMVTRSMSSQYVMPLTASRIHFSGEQFIWGLGVGALVSVLAALWPSLRAASVKPLEAMKKFEGAQQAGNKKIFTKRFYVGCLMLCYLLLSSFGHWGGKNYVLGILEQGCTMFGSALVAPALVTILILCFKKLFLNSSGAVTRLSSDNLLRHPQRTGSNVMTLMIGLILVIMVASLSKSFKTTLNDWFKRVLAADVLISSSGKLFSFQVQPLDESLGREIEKSLGIRRGPLQSVYALRFAHLNYEGKQIGLKAFDIPDPHNNYSLLDMKSGGKATDIGPQLFDSSKNNVLVSEIFVFHHPKKPGDILVLNTPTGAVEFKILGVMVDYASSEGMVYMSRDVYKKYWRDNLVDGFSLNVDGTLSISDVRRDIEARLGKEKNIVTVSQKEMKDSIMNEVDKSFAYTRAIEAAALLVAFLGLFNTFLISVMERTREIGLLRAIGMDRRQVLIMIIQEALLQGAFGAVVAIVLGSGIAYIFVKNNLTSMLGWIVDFSFPWSIVGITLLLGIAVTILAAFYPARHAAKLEIREALDYE